MTTILSFVLANRWRHRAGVGNMPSIVMLLVWPGLCVLGVNATQCRDTSAADTQIVPKERREDILRFLAAQNEDNFLRIRTWKGAYSFVDDSLAGFSAQPPLDIQSREGDRTQVSKLLLRREGIVSFSLDIDQQKLFVDYDEEQSKASATTTDRKKAVSLPEDYSGHSEESLVVPDSITSLQVGLQHGPIKGHADDPYVKRGSSQMAKKRVKEHNLWRRDWDTVVDPRRFFAISTTYIWDELTLYADALAGKQGEVVRKRVNKNLQLAIERHDGALHYVLTMKYENSFPKANDEGVLSKAVVRFAENTGFLPVEAEFFRSDHRLEKFWSWRYRDEGGIRIPEEFHYKHDFGAHSVFDRHLVLKQVSINEGLEAGVFSNESLSLEKGDRLIDTIEEKLYVHNGDRLVSASAFVAIENDSRLSMWIWLNVAVVIVIGGLLFWKRQRTASAKICDERPVR